MAIWPNRKDKIGKKHEMSTKCTIKIIQNAGKIYLNAETSKIDALSEMYKIYFEASLNTQNGQKLLAYINAAFDRYKNAHTKIPKTPHLSNKIAWLSRLKDKRLVSDVHIILSAAKKDSVSAIGFTNWVAENNGLQNILLNTRKPKAPSEKSSKTSAKSVNNTVSALYNNGPVKNVQKSNPGKLAIGRGEFLVNITTINAEGLYETVEMKIRKDRSHYYPNTSNASSTPQKQSAQSKLNQIKNSAQISSKMQLKSTA